MWDKLSMKEKSELMRMYIQNGITNITQMKEHYNKFADGGNKDKKSYEDWKNRLSKYKGIDIDNDNTYDYISFYNEDPGRAYSMLKDSPDAHFTDKYKLPTHPTFSTESIYSNDKTKGGVWVEYPNNKWEFQHSDFTANHSDETNRYLRRSDPNAIATYMGGRVLDSVNIYANKSDNKFAEGGNLGNNKNTPKNTTTTKTYLDRKGIKYNTRQEAENANHSYVQKGLAYSVNGKVYMKDNPEHVAEAARLVQDEVARKQESYHNRIVDQNSKTEYFPYMKDKKITLTNAGAANNVSLSTNQLDSIAKYANRAGLDLKKAFGLAVDESTLLRGKMTYFGNNNESGMNPQDLTSNWNETYRENPYNNGKSTAYPYNKDTEKRDYEKNKFAIENGQYWIKKVDKGIESGKYDIPEKPMHILESSFEWFKKYPKTYDSRKEDHIERVNKKGDDLFRSPEFQKWLQTSEYAKGKKD